MHLGIDIGGTAVKALVAPAMSQGSALDLNNAHTAVSAHYARPTWDALRGAITEVVGRLALGDVATVGLCAPGRREPEHIVRQAVNLPCLEDRSLLELVPEALPAPSWIGPDTAAAAIGFLEEADEWDQGVNLPLLALSIGTGVGACLVEPDGAGFTVRPAAGLGQAHLEGLGVGETLESCLGLPALRARHGDNPTAQFEALGADTEEGRALDAALRHIHEVWAPATVVLLGGVGVRLAPLAGRLTTPMAVVAGRSRFHAAAGAAAAGLQGGSPAR